MIKFIFILAESSLSGMNLLGNVLETFAGPDTLDQVIDISFGIIEDALDQGLQRGISGLKTINILFIYTFPPMVRVRVVDALSAINGSACCTGWQLAIALGSCQHGLGGVESMRY